MKNKPWYDVLLAARRLEKKMPDGWTSQDLAQEAKIEATSVSSEIAIASAWCGKLYRWGYALGVGRKPPSGRGRPTNIYKLTSWGHDFRTEAAKGKERPVLRMVPAPKLRIAANPPKKEK